MSIKAAHPKYLVVDDEIAKTDSLKEGFSKIMELPLEQGVFASNYEKACQILKSNSNIILCFIDCILPENQSKYLPDSTIHKQYHQKKYQLNLDSPNEHEWGIKLIKEIEHIKTLVFSGHLSEYDLKKIVNKYSHVIGCFTKPTLEAAILEIKKLYLEDLFKQEIKTVIPEVEIVSKSFDYSFLDKDVSLFVQERTQEIRRLARRTAQDIFNIGVYLIEVKAKLGHGNFYDWLDAEFNWSYSSAARFMSVANKFKTVNLGDLAIVPSVLYELASPSLPEPITTEVLERAKEGENITLKILRNLKSQHKKAKKKNSENTESLAQKKAELKANELDSATQTQNSRRTRREVNSNSSSVIQKIIRPQQKILKVEAGEKAEINSWWQLGKHHRLFCGEPKSDKFFQKLPLKIALAVNLPPNNDFSLIPPLKSDSDFSFRSQYNTELRKDWLIQAIQKCIWDTVAERETVIFCYAPYPELLEVATKMDSHFIVAEPNLEKCDRILAHWREKESVKKIIS